MPAPISTGGTAVSAPSSTGTNRSVGSTLLPLSSGQATASTGGLTSRPGHARAFQGMMGQQNLWSTMGGYDPELFMRAIQGMLPGGMYGQMAGSQGQYNPFMNGYGSEGGYGL